MNAPPVQEIYGKIRPGEIDIFVLSGLKKRAKTLCFAGEHFRKSGSGPIACSRLR